MEIHLDTSQHTYRFFEKSGFSVKKISKNGYGEGLDKYDMILKRDSK
jgi:[ribosomal protein S18]-alanine N-acetyltransferase